MKTSQIETEEECCALDNQISSSNNNKPSKKRVYRIKARYLIATSFILLITGLGIEYLFQLAFFKSWLKLVFYLIAYIPVAYPVYIATIKTLKKGEVFTEFFLMSIATIGAFLIGEYPEAVAVMLFYTIGELFQARAVKKAKRNITALLDIRPKTAKVYRNGVYTKVKAEMVTIGERVQILAGEKLPVDGILLSEYAFLNTSNLTGESKPVAYKQGQKLMAGAINLNNVIEIESEKLFKDSAIAKIMDLVQNASTRKAKTELLIRRLAKVYTPVVSYMAIALTLLPYFFVENYVFYDWFYRALIFLVISCPCALVISIPLGYFGGLGAASKHGILFKGANFMDVLTRIKTLVVDKTGTLTHGVFKLKKIISVNGTETSTLMSYLLSLEAQSSHPIAKAILAYPGKTELYQAVDVIEIPGKGLEGKINGDEVLAGNQKLLNQFNITVPEEISKIIDTVVLVAINNHFAGYVTIADEIKNGTHEALETIRKLGIESVIMLSGDKNTVAQNIARELGINRAIGDLLPEAKLNELMHIKSTSGAPVAFIGDGINDAPVLAASDLGLAMGTLGSDAAIETADIILQNDELSKFVTAFRISKSTQKVIWQNIILAFGVKAFVLGLGAFGLVNMWAAVFADVGVALLAILNAVRLQKMNWRKI